MTSFVDFILLTAQEWNESESFFSKRKDFTALRLGLTLQIFSLASCLAVA